MKIRPVEAEFFQAEGCKDGLTEMQNVYFPVTDWFV